MQARNHRRLHVPPSPQGRALLLLQASLAAVLSEEEGGNTPSANRDAEPRPAIHPVTNLPARFWAKVNKNGPVPEARPDLGPCWLWMAGCNRDGYANYSLKGRTVGGHRISYIDSCGPIQEGLQLDHLCRVRSCVRPSHLEPVTCQLNLHRGTSPTMVVHLSGVCRRGHLLSAENTYRQHNGRGIMCKICHKLSRDARR